MAESPHVSECSTTLTERKYFCACGCGEAFTLGKGIRRFKRGHYRFIPDQHVVDPETGCWLWTGKTTRCGHGRARNNKGLNEHAHRLYYEALVRPLGDDEIAHHDPDKCHNKLCCNPDHQKIVSKSEHQSYHATEQWKRQRSDPSLRAIGNRCTITEEQRDELRAVYAAGGVSQRKLAARYGLSPAIIQQTLRPRSDYQPQKADPSAHIIGKREQVER